LGYECIEGYDWDYQTTKERLTLIFVGLVVRSRFKIDATLIDAGEQLEWIARRGAGLENIDVHFAESKGIACLKGRPKETATPFLNTRSVCFSLCLTIFYALINRYDKAHGFAKEIADMNSMEKP
jgi:lactate dehydrogenase-like 2-hydroxyacid dehydrogenase